MPQYVANEMGEMVLSDEVSVVDVYDLASDIGKECEKIIEIYGTSSVTELMPKVINALELLEALATKNEGENTQAQELNDRIAQLETDKLEKAEYRKRFEKVNQFLSINFKETYFLSCLPRRHLIKRQFYTFHDYLVLKLIFHLLANKTSKFITGGFIN